VKIYVASSWRNERQPDVVAALRAAGHEVYDFKNPGSGMTGFGWKKILPDPAPWSAEKTREVLEHPIAQAGFDSDINAMCWADAIVMVQPCGRSAALELGWGAGAGKLTVALLADGQEPELMLKVADKIALSLDEVITWLSWREMHAAPDLGATVVHLEACALVEKARADMHRDELHAAHAEAIALRAIIEGRTVAPTPREIELHAAAGGWWLWECDTVAGEDEDPQIVQRVVDDHRQKQRATRWWAMGANRLPCAWPVAMEAPGR